MADKLGLKITYEAEKILQPIFTGGSVSLDRNGRILATCVGEDALLTDLSTGEKLARIEGDGELITSLCLAPSASYVILCSRSLSMRIFSLKPTSSSPSSPDVQLTKTLKPHTSPVAISTCDSTSTLLATGGADGVIKVWDLRGGYNTHTFHGHRSVISALCFFETQGGVQRNDESGRRDRKRPRRSETETSVQSPQYEESVKIFFLASGAEDGQIRVWDLQKRKSIASVTPHVSAVTGLDFSGRENALVSGSRDKTVMVWDANTWKLRATIPVLETIESAGFVNHGNLLYTGGESGRIRLWDTASGREVTQEQDAGGEGEGILDIVYHDNLDYMLSVHNDQTLIFHSLDSIMDVASQKTTSPLRIIGRISGTLDEVIDLAYVGPDQSLLAVATNTEHVRLLSLHSAKSPSASGKTETALSPIGRYFGADVALLRGHEEIIICMDADWSGHWLVTGSKDNTARLWRIDPSTNSYTCYATYTGHAESIGAVALAKARPPKDSAAFAKPLEHHPKFLISGSQDKTIKFWEISSTSEEKKASRAAYTRKAHDKDINSIDISHDQSLFATASQDRTVKIWAVGEGETQGVLRGHRRGVWSVKFAPKETPPLGGNSSGGPAGNSKGLVLTGSGDKTLKIWSLTDYSCLLTFEGHTNSVLKVLWLPRNNQSEQSTSLAKQGVQIASAGGDGLVKIWDAQTNECVCTLDNHVDRVWALAVNPRAYFSSLDRPSSAGTPSEGTAIPEHNLISGAADSTITFWRDTTATTLAATTAASTARVEQDQALQNYIHNHSYREAITLALQLNHPARLLALFTSVADTYPPEEGSLSGINAVDEVLANLGDEQLFILLLRLRDWNTNARTAPVAQKILNVLVKSYPASRFIELRGRAGRKFAQGDLDGDAVRGEGKGRGLVDVLEGLRVYTERHLRRMEELWDESWLVDYTLREMDEVNGVMNTNGANGHASYRDQQEEDVIMVG